MILGIMQPYFFPYIGYWQLMNAVDKYVIADDLNFIKGGYINRNRILCNGEPSYFRLPVQKISQNKPICEHTIGLDEAEIHKLLQALTCSYKHAPYYDRTFEHVKEVLDYGLTDEGKNLSVFLENANRKTAEVLGITTPIYVSSRDLKLDDSYKREFFVVEMCKRMGATEYYNAIGGTKLYCQKFFRENGLGLKFVKTDESIKYNQYGEDFVPNLSIIDIMMFCSTEESTELLTRFTLEDGQEEFIET